MITHIEMEHLSFIKYLYRLGLDQSNLNDPNRASSILSFHDSIELFLDLACQHNNIYKKDINFMAYFDELEKKVPGLHLSNKNEIRRLNNARVQLKHQNVRPSRIELDKHKNSVTEFFKNNTRELFNLEFNDISMVNLIKYDAVKQYLINANVLIEEGKNKKAIKEVAKGFYCLLKVVQDEYIAKAGIRPFQFGPDFKIFFPEIHSIHDAPMAGNIEDLRSGLHTVQNAIKIISLSLDYRRYVIFKEITPGVTHFDDGDWIFGQSNVEDPTIEEYQFCYDFVIDCALTLHNISIIHLSK